MIVVDATVAIKLMTREPGAEAARTRIVREADRIAPDWIRMEVANALARKVTDSQLPASVVPVAMTALPALLTELVDSHLLLDDAVRLALDLRHAVYDCLYLALAERRDAVLVTHDAKFAKAARRGGFGARVELLDGLSDA